MLKMVLFRMNTIESLKLNNITSQKELKSEVNAKLYYWDEVSTPARKVVKMMFFEFSSIITYKMNFNFKK